MPGTLLRARLLAKLLKRLLDVLHVLTRLFEMLLEAELQLLVGRLLSQLRQRLHKHVLGIEHITQLVQEQLSRITHTSHADPFLVLLDNSVSPISSEPNDPRPERMLPAGEGRAMMAPVRRLQAGPVAAANDRPVDGQQDD